MAEDVKTIKLARIESFDPAKMVANVTILQTEEGEKNELFGIPVSCLRAGGFIIKPPYQQGDIVNVAFSSISMDEVLISGKEENVSITEQFRNEDAVVQFGIPTMGDSFPAEHAEDLVIAKDDYSSKIVLTNDGDIIIQSDGNVLLGESAEEGVPLGTTLKGWIDSHVHPISWTDGGGSGTSGPPTTPSPDPSEKVKIE